jgi:N4-gp56 family major capsid protein
MAFDGQQYRDPAGGTQSTIGNKQFNTQYWEKKALIEARKTQFFTQLASVQGMPKNFGKKIVRYHYIPLLDDANLNDQGIDAAGVTITGTQYFVTLPRAVMAVANASKAAAATAIQDNLSGTTCVAGADGSGGTGLATLTVTGTLQIKVATLTKANAILAFNLGASVQQGSGNLYGSSKDIGTISGKLPALSETGGRVNRVGFKRKELEGTFEKFGFFHEWTRDSLDFDTDAELQQHIHRELLAGAAELTEDALQVDLLSQAGVVKFAGDAVSHQTMDADCLVSYGDLMRLSIDLDNNRTPKQLTAFTGTRLVDTRTISGARALYCGSELIPTLRAMKDLHNQPAFIPVEKYSAGGSTLLGEQGSVGDWRIIIVPEMTKWAGHGADASGDTENYTTNGRFDVFPMLAVGEESFTTISFQTDGQSSKFKIYQKDPGEATADRTDPFGETGFASIKWWYGFMLLRGERLAVLKTVARM